MVRRARFDNIKCVLFCWFIHVMSYGWNRQLTFDHFSVQGREQNKKTKPNQTEQTISIHQSEHTNLNGNVIVFIFLLFFYFFRLDNRIMPAKVSFDIDLGPDLSNEIMDVARKQGEDPDRIRANIQELRDMILGKCRYLCVHFIEN